MVAATLTHGPLGRGKAAQPLWPPRARDAERWGPLQTDWRPRRGPAALAPGRGIPQHVVCRLVAPSSGLAHGHADDGQ
eukprot:14593673-Alexandrium_andersonii.AAC.1